MRWYKCEGFTTYGIEYSKEGSVEKVQYSIDGVIAGFYTRNPERKEELLDDKMLQGIFTKIIRCGDDDATRELACKVKGHDAKVLSDALCAEVERCNRALKSLNNNR